MQKNCKFTLLKLTFSILHSHFYKIPISVSQLYTFIQIKYSKPNHHQPNQYPRINTQQNPLINCVSTKFDSSSLYQVKQEPQASAFVVTLTSTKPTHHVLENSATTSFLGLMRRGLLVDLNEPPPLWFAY